MLTHEGESVPKKNRPIITVDVETDPFKRLREPMPFLWGMWDGNTYRHWPHAEPMMRYLSTQEAIVYAHNGGKFDWTYIFDYLEPYTEILIISGRVARFQIGTCEFRDSWNILPVPLKKLGKGGIEFWKLEADVRDKHMEEIIRYNKQDCTALWDAVTGFTSLYGQKLTLASAALDFWSKHFKHEKPETDADFYELVKPYYCGGRVQCFHKGSINKLFHVVDINSAYPYAMTHKHPVSTRYDSVIPDKDEEITPQSLYRIEATSNGGLPYKNEKGELTFPDDGEWREFTITGWELIACIETDTLKGWKPLERRDFLEEIDFQDYVGHFFKMKADAKKAGNDLEYQFAKLMQNSLYGKFGANPKNYATFGIVPCQDISAVIMDPTITLGKNNGPWDWAGNLGKFALMEGKCPATGERNAVRSQYYNVATAASITGFVRSFLWRHICAVRKAGGRVLYCDTDSIVYQLAGPKESHPFKFSDELGDWSHEGTFDRGGVAGKKLYSFHMSEETLAKKRKKLKPGEKLEELKTACKGVKITPEEIMRVVKGETVRWEAEAPQPNVHRKLKKGQTHVPAKFMHRNVRMT